MTKKQVKSKRLIAAKNLKRGLIGLFAILAIIFIINSPILKIGYVKVTGNSYLPREDVLQIARITEPINIFFCTNRCYSKLFTKRFTHRYS